MIDPELYPKDRVVSVELYVVYEICEPSASKSGEITPIVKGSRVARSGNEAVWWFMRRMGDHNIAWGTQCACSKAEIAYEFNKNGKVSKDFHDNTGHHTVKLCMERFEVDALRIIPEEGKPYADVVFCYQTTNGLPFKGVPQSLVPLVNLCGSENAADIWLTGKMVSLAIKGCSLTPESMERWTDNTRSILDSEFTARTKDNPPFESVFHVKKRRVVLEDLPFGPGDLLICKPEEEKRTPDNVDFEVYAEVLDTDFVTGNITLARYTKQGRLPFSDTALIPYWDVEEYYKPMNDEERAVFLANTGRAADGREGGTAT